MTLSQDERADLRDMRDEAESEEDKRLLRKTLNYISHLETKLSTVRTLLRTALNESHIKPNNVSEGDER